jgi:hypothetical protein
MDENWQGDLLDRQKTSDYRGKGRANNSLLCYTRDSWTRYQVMA